MTRTNFAFVFIAAIALSALPVRAQGVSPHETITTNIDGNDVKLVYGRPFSVKPGTTEVRKIWGTLVPWAQPWRMGADQATTLTIAQPIMIGETNVPAGSYTLYLIPQEKDGSKMAISKTTGQWGIPVDTAHDLARVDAKKDPMDKDVNQYTMDIDKNPAGGGVIKLMWEKTQFSVPFTVKK